MKGFYDTILFDFDGVLADTAQLHSQCLAKAVYQWFSEKHKPSNNGVDYANYFEHMGTITSLEKLRLVFPEFVEESILEIYALKKEIYKHESWYKIAGSATPLELFKQLSFTYKLGIVSNSNVEAIEINLTAMGLYDTFKGSWATIIGNDSSRVFNAKPAPDGYNEAMRLLKAAPARTIVFEDSADGARAATAANVGCLFRVSHPKETWRLLDCLL